MAALNGEMLKRALSSCFHSLVHQLFFTHVTSVCWRRHQDRPILQPDPGEFLALSLRWDTSVGSHRHAGAVAGSIGERQVTGVGRAGSERCLPLWSHEGPLEKRWHSSQAFTSHVDLSHWRWVGKCPSIRDSTNNVSETRGCREKFGT